MDNFNTQPNERIPQEPVQQNQWIPQEPVQQNQWIPQEPVQQNQWIPQEPVQQNQWIPQEPVQQNQWIPPEPVQQNQWIPQEPVQQNQWISQEPVQQNQWIPQEPVQQNQWIPQEPVQQPPKKKRTFLIIAACIALVAILGATSVFAYAQFTPEKRLARHLDAGDKYLDELDYERALASYQAALEIEPNDLDARLGIIEASYYLDTDDLSEVYSETLEIVASLNDEQLAKNNESISEIYEWAFYIYPDDYEKVVAILEEGYTSNPDNDYIKELLIEAYDTLANTYYQYGYYEQMLDIYKRWGNIDPSNTSLATKFSDGLSDYLYALVNEGNTDKATEVINENFNIAANIVLAPALTSMENKDIETMTTIDGADLTNAFVTAIDSSPCIFTANGPVTNYTGTALGIYPFGEGGYYFYYGNYENGSREGQGFYFIKSSATYCTTFEGNWENDKPNGLGTITGHVRTDEFSSYNSYYTYTQTGTFINGLGNGTFDCVLNDYSRGLPFYGSFTTENGILTDVYDNYPQYHYDYIDFDNDHYAGYKIYTIYTSNSTDWIWWSRTSDHDAKFGLSGFVE